MGTWNANEFGDGANFPNDSEGISRLHSKKCRQILVVGGRVIFITMRQLRAQSQWHRAGARR